MASNLLEILKGGTTIQVPGVASADAETEQLKRLASAKTGRDVGTSGPRASNLQAQSAAGQAQAAANVQNSQYEAATQNILAREDAQNQQQESVNAGLDEQRLASQQKLADESSNLIQQAKNENLRLDSAEDRAKLEQLGVVTRLASEKYIDELERNGALARLEDQNVWEQEYLRAVFGDNTELLKQKLNYNDLLNMDQNEFKARIGAMDIDMAIQVAMGAAKQQNTQAQYESAGTLVSGVAGMMSAMDKSETTDK